MAAMSGSEDLTERTFQHTWIIQDWDNVVQSESMRETEFRLETGNDVYAKFSVKAYFFGTYFRFHWTLISKHPCLDNIKADLVAEIPIKDGGLAQYLIQSKEMIVGKSYSTSKPVGGCIGILIDESENTGGEMLTLDEIKIRVGNLFLGPLQNQGHSINSLKASLVANRVIDSVTNSEGSLEITLLCTLKDLPDATCVSEIEEFSSSSKEKLSQNFKSLLDDISTSDVKIITKDDTELYAHKNILKARCPYFASMFGSGFLENSTGFVKVEDISSKTMKILLHFWYTGELLSSWKDDDTIVEFSFASAKYQIREILKLLNDCLGREFETSPVDVELLKTTHQLSLKEAEARIFNRIIYKICNAVSGKEILDLFSIPAEALDKNSVEATKVFKSFNDIMCTRDNVVVTYQEYKLLSLAVNFGMKDVEHKILKRIEFTFRRVNSTEELLALFDIKEI